MTGRSAAGICPRCGKPLSTSTLAELRRCAVLAAAAGREQVPCDETGEDCGQCGRPLVVFGSDIGPTCAGCRCTPDACPCPVLAAV